MGFINLPFNLSMLRLLRCVRLLRLVRLIRRFQGFDALHLMVTALSQSLWALLWTIVMLVLIQMFVALVLSTFMRTVYMNPSSPLDEDEQLKLFEYFGTYPRSMVSLFELALGNWPTICRFLMETVNEFFCVFVILYKIILGIAVLGVTNAVFIQETFKAASADDTIMLRNKKRARAIHKRKMQHLFNSATASTGGVLTRPLFRELIKDVDVQTWLASMDLDTKDADLLFDLLNIGDDNMDELSLDELIDGIGMLKGYARAIDMKYLLSMMMTEQLRQDEKPLEGCSVQAGAKNTC
jgi:hypothetical protein